MTDIERYDVFTLIDVPWEYTRVRTIPYSAKFLYLRSDK